jgi:hypothetical protein
MAFYKYVSFNVLKYILEGDIRFTQAGDFNDPFELAVEVYNPYGGARSMLDMRFDTLGTPRKAENYLLQGIHSSDECNDLFTRELRTNLDKKIGFLCLTKNPFSHLMWSHYADCYRGAVVEFDENHEFFNGAFEIKYLKERPKLHIDYFLDQSEISTAELCMKSDEWAYEKEWRLTRSLSDCKLSKNKSCTFPIYTGKLPNGIIKNIILGERTKLSDAKHVFRHIKNTEIKMQLAVLANWKYEFRIENVKFDRPVSEMLPPISPLTAPIFLEERGEFGNLAKWIHEKHPMNEIIKWRL